jgi:hypothetical protein
MANANRRKYFGSIESLKAAVTSTGAVGIWTVRDEPRLHTFRSSAGEIINWWPRTRTLQFQGCVSTDFVFDVINALGASVHQTEQTGEQLLMLQ